MNVHDVAGNLLADGDELLRIAGDRKVLFDSILEIARASAVNGHCEMAKKIASWSEQRDRRTLQWGLEVRKSNKRAFFNELFLRVGRYAREEGGQLPSGVPPRILVQSIIGSGIDPFLSSTVPGSRLHLSRRLTGSETELRDEGPQAEQARPAPGGAGSGDLGRQVAPTVFNWGTAELFWRTDSDCRLLDCIAASMNFEQEGNVLPERVRAVQAYHHGRYGESLEIFLDLDRKGRGDHVISQSIGHIYLFVDAHHDFARAIEYFEKAATQSRSTSPRHTIFALIHKALACYLSSPGLDRAEAAAEAVRSALDFAMCTRCSFFAPELGFQLAHYEVLSGDIDFAMLLLRELLIVHPPYIVSVLAEEDFLFARERVLDVFSDSMTQLMKAILERLDRHRISLQLAARGEPGAQDPAEAPSLAVIRRVCECVRGGGLAALSEARGMIESIPFAARSRRPEAPSHAGGSSSAEYGWRPYSAADASFSTPLWAVGGELL